MMLQTLQSHKSLPLARQAPYVPVMSITSARFEVFKLTQLLAMEAAIFCGVLKPKEVINLAGETLLEVSFESFNFAMSALDIKDKAINGRQGAALIAAPITYTKFKHLVEFGVRKKLYRHGHDSVGHGRRHVKILSTSRGIDGALKIDDLIESVMESVHVGELRHELRLRPDLARYVSILKQVGAMKSHSPGATRAITWP
jgi:hypothetical protein